MPPKASYLDRVFTTGEVAFPGTKHIGEEKDFHAGDRKGAGTRRLFAKDRQLYGVNGGREVTTGFGRETVLSHAGAISSRP
jgi:hydroxylamine reductase